MKTQMASPLFDLSGRRALITGSSQGIGFAMAEGLASHGAEVVLNGRDLGKLQAAVETVRAQGAVASAYRSARRSRISRSTVGSSD